MSGRQRTLFAGVMIVAAFAMIRSRAPRTDTQLHAPSGLVEALKQPRPESVNLPVVPPTPKTKLANSKVPVSLSQPTTLEQEHQSIETLSTILSQSTHTEASPANLVEQLERAGLQPAASRDADPDTGSMIVIQTKNALPGSRYFRAQYFSDEDGNYTPQHISFELRPGTPQRVVDAALAKAFGPLPKPTFKDGEWTSYKNVVPGYTVWTKILNAVDVTENAISAHSKDDIGTIQVAIEKELPGHEHEL